MNKKMLVVGLTAVAVLSLGACGKKKNDSSKTYTYNTYTAVSPSNWNELTYQDNNDTQIMSYIGGSFFTFNYDFDANGKIIDGGFKVEYDGAKGLKDVTDEYAGKEGFSVPEDAESSYAYEITLRDDLKWDDGTEIHAEDFVYTMSEQLNPLFFNYRADSFYNGSLVIHNAKNYLFGGSHAYASPMISENYGDDEYVDMSLFKDRTDGPADQGKWGYEDESGEFHDILLDFAVSGNWGSYETAYYLTAYCASAARDADGYTYAGVFASDMDWYMDRPTVRILFKAVTDEEGNVTDYLFKDAAGATLTLDDNNDILDASGNVVANFGDLSTERVPNADYKVLLDAVNSVSKTATQLLLDATTVAALQNCIAKMHGAADVAAYAASAGDYAYLEWQEMAYLGADYPVIDFDKVGLFVGSTPNTLVIVLDNPLSLLKEDGKTLSYKAAYNFGSLPLVNRAKYEANKVAPKEGSTLWTSTYNSSVASTASWGPYKLTSFQAGKQYILERNENWYGYNMSEYEGQYQTDRIVCETIEEWNTAWLAFQQGDIAQIGIDVSIASDYVNSSRAVFTADDFVGSMQLQSDADSLKAREADYDEAVDKEILAYTDFRKAISLAINRDAYCAACTTASKAGFGLFNSMHYYDVENGGVYRNEEVAKQVLCEVYGVDVEQYSSLDEAYAAVNGYNPTLAKQLVTSAYRQALADGRINGSETAATDKVVLTLGTSADSEPTRRVYNFINEALKEMVVGTPLEGKLEVEFDASFGSSWANDFRNGAYDICTGGWTGAAWDPGYFLLAYLSPDYMYSKAWDTSSETLKYDPDGDGEEYEELTMTLIDWYNCLNGVSGSKYNFAEGIVDVEIRLGIIAQLEKAVLLKYYTVPLYNYFSAQLRSFKIEYGSNTYNTFMGYGGIRYITYNYDDAAWEGVKADFNYKA